MATINDVKQKMLDKMYSMDLTHMTLLDAGQYVSILRSLNDIGTDSPYQALMDSCLSAMNHTRCDGFDGGLGTIGVMGGEQHD